jgi:hypothetical protein
MCVNQSECTLVGMATVTQNDCAELVVDGGDLLAQISKIPVILVPVRETEHCELLIHDKCGDGRRKIGNKTTLLLQHSRVEEESSVVKSRLSAINSEPTSFMVLAGATGLALDGRMRRGLG